MGNLVGGSNMNRARGSQEQAATAAATPLQRLCRDVTGKPEDPSTLPQRPQHYSHVPRSEYSPGDIFGMSSGVFSRGSSTVGFQASALFGLDGLQRRTQGWGKLVDGSRWPGDIWTIDGSVSLERSSGGSDAGGKSSDEVSHGRVDADIKTTTEEVRKQKHSVGNTSTTSSPTENRTKKTPAVPGQDCKRSRDSPIGGTAAGGAWTQLPPGARAKDDGQPGPDRFDNGPACTAEAAESSNVPSSKAQVVQKEQEPHMGLQSPISSHPPSLALAKPYHHHAHFSPHNASQLNIASPSSSSTRNSKPPGDRASKFPDPISPSRNSSIPAFQPSATTPSSSSATSWHSLSPNASSLLHHRADSSLHLDHHPKLASTSPFSQRLLPLHAENKDRMSANDRKTLSGNNPDDAYKVQGTAGMFPTNRFEAIPNQATNVMPTGARPNQQDNDHILKNRLGEAIDQASKTTFAEERLRELWAAGQEMMSGANRFRNAESMRNQQGEHATSAATSDDDIYNASDDEAKGAFSHQAERRFTGEIARTRLAGEVIRNNQGDYYLDRGNGRCTKLIPADMLPPLVDVPAIQLSAPGMTILPVPTGAGHAGRSVYHQPVQMATPFAAQTTDPGSSSLVPLRGSPDNVQSRIDSIVANQPPPTSPKRAKVYCDKWVHEGICAFTQQGCKYKHEMPYDKATQLSLGLFHGFPPWWRRHQAELQGALMGAPGGEHALLLGGGRALGGGGGDMMAPAPSGPIGVRYGQMVPTGAAREQHIRQLPWRRPAEAPSPRPQAPVFGVAREGYQQSGRGGTSAFPTFPGPAHDNIDAPRAGSGPGTHWGAVGTPVPAPTDVTSGGAARPHNQQQQQPAPGCRGGNRFATANMFSALQSSPESSGSTGSSRGPDSGAKLTKPGDDDA